jgi:hypothetical protein
MQNVVIQKNDLLKDFGAGVYLREGENLIPPPPLHTRYVYTEYLFNQGRGGGAC